MFADLPIQLRSILIHEGITTISCHQGGWSPTCAMAMVALRARQVALLYAAAAPGVGVARDGE